METRLANIAIIVEKEEMCIRDRWKRRDRN